MSAVRVRKGRLHARERRMLRNGGHDKRSGVYRCHYCALAMTSEQVTWDHKVPVIAGGNTHGRNLVPACKDCNGAKGPMRYDLFKSWMLPVKKARLAGDEIPALGPRPVIAAEVIRIQARAERQDKARRLERDGYTKDLLFDCLRVQAMRRAGRAWEEVAEIVGHGAQAVRVMEKVAATPAGRRQMVAEQLRLVELVKSRA